MREATQSWREVLLSLKSCGMNTPKLAIRDGATGFWAALDEVYPTTRQQRCWQRKTMNVLNCLPKLSQPKAKAAIHNIWQAETKDDAEKAFDLLVKTCESKYPKAALCLQKDRAELMAFFELSAPHQAFKGLFVTRWHAAHDVQAGTMRGTKLEEAARL